MSLRSSSVRRTGGASDVSWIKPARTPIAGRVNFRALDVIRGKGHAIATVFCVASEFVQSASITRITLIAATGSRNGFPLREDDGESITNNVWVGVNRSAFS